MASVFSKIIDQLEMDEVLAGIGLQRKQPLGATATALGLFAAGLAIGAAASLLLAPKAGDDIRGDFAERVNAIREDLGSRVQSMMNKGGRYNPPS